MAAIFVGGWDTGWTGYPPLSVRAPLGMQLFFIGVYLIGLSSIVGSANILVTVARMRTPGMRRPTTCSVGPCWRPVAPVRRCQPHGYCDGR